jgi:hypothetical protein
VCAAMTRLFGPGALASTALGDVRRCPVCDAVVPIRVGSPPCLKYCSVRCRRRQPRVRRVVWGSASKHTRACLLRTVPSSGGDDTVATERAGRAASLRRDVGKAMKVEIRRLKREIARLGVA